MIIDYYKLNLNIENYHLIYDYYYTKSW